MRKQGLYTERDVPRKGKYPRTRGVLGILWCVVICCDTEFRDSALRLGRYGDDHGIQINITIWIYGKLLRCNASTIRSPVGARDSSGAYSRTCSWTLDGANMCKEIRLG